MHSTCVLLVCFGSCSLFRAMLMLAVSGTVCCVWLCVQACCCQACVHNGFYQVVCKHKEVTTASEMICQGEPLWGHAAASQTTSGYQ